jgi:hypothetical protein
MVLNQFNGRVAVKLLQKTGVNFSVAMVFKDDTLTYRGIDARLGDYVFLKASDGRYVRLKVTAIERQTAYNIKATLTDETATVRYFNAQNGAMVRETRFRKYPVFPANIEQTLLDVMLSHYSILSDFEFDDCNGLLTAADLDGTEILSVKKDGEMKCLPISELVEFTLTLKSPNGTRRRLELTDYEQADWAKRDPSV